MPSTTKINKVSSLKDIFKDAKAIYLVDFTGLTVPEITELRQKIKDKNGLLKVVNNRLAKIALEETGFKEINEKLTGPNALLITYEDVIAPLKEAYEFLKELKKGALKEGIIKGAKIYTKEEIISLAKLPSAGELRAKAVQVLNAPIAMLVWNLKGVLSKLVYILKNLEEKNKNL